MKINKNLSAKEQEIVLNNWLDFYIDQGAIMPEPKQNEKKDDFITRCIPQVLQDGTAEDVKQAAAICMSLWRRRNDKKNK